MRPFRSEFIRPLGAAENHFLEVLLFEFDLERHDAGSTLRVRFDDRTPTIWRNKGKEHARARMPNFARKAREYQERLDSLLLGKDRGKWTFRDPAFPFRYASGGTLPIIRFGGEQYYCLFYRDIFPIGWNIANGGCDARRELLDPIVTVEREFREELIAIHPAKRKQYVFEAEEGNPLERPEFEDARRYWQARKPGLNFDEMDKVTIPLQWLQGPDRVVVQYGSDPPHEVKDCFLNINALDFGIEVDKVAKVSLDERAILLDGEISAGFLLNEPIGLFRTDALDSRVEEDAREYRPDLLFWDGRPWRGSDIDDVLEKFLDYLAVFRTTSDLKAYRSCGNKLDLCPVTRRIVSRYAALRPRAPRRSPGCVDVFISVCHEDVRIAERVRAYLGDRRVSAFCSSQDIRHPYFPPIIDDALDSARTLVAVATRADYLRRPWVEYEWRSFFTTNRLLGKRRDARMISFTSGISPLDLPRVFVLCQQVEFAPRRIERGLEELAKYVLEP
ncbi:MAG: toll/interleukin-1 receptor domain-containing protein [Candidatus Eisenbacteria bacterium]|nr:toll/interleukin-1 receptor domain-containing protein [Candidatus Eisenbacteria bacterium]